MKTNAERTIEALTWAAVVIWMGFALIMHLLGYVWLVVMVLSIIFLTSAIYQRSRGWHTSLMIWIAGVWMAVFSVIEVVNQMLSALNDGKGLQVDLWVYLGIALISMGLAVVLRNLQAPGAAAGRHKNEDAARPPIVPTPVQDDMSSGYLSPTGETRAYYDTSRRDSVNTGATSAVRATPAEPQSSSRSRRRARPAGGAPEPTDLESRVEDIIRRSRERRDQDNLPY